MNKHFFELPKAVKRAVWAALMAEWQRKRLPTAPPVNSLLVRMNKHFFKQSDFTTERK